VKTSEEKKIIQETPLPQQGGGEGSPSFWTSGRNRQKKTCNKYSQPQGKKKRGGTVHRGSQKPIQGRGGKNEVLTDVYSLGGGLKKKGKKRWGREEKKVWTTPPCIAGKDIKAMGKYSNHL